MKLLLVILILYFFRKPISNAIGWIFFYFEKVVINWMEEYMDKWEK